MTTGIELIKRFEQFASPQLAESWDHVGLQLGDPRRPIHRLMTTLDVRPAVVAEAIEKQVDFIFAHHPVMFHPAKDLDLRNPQNQMYADLLAHHITVYAAHTNLDTANGGMNDWLAQQLGLVDTEPLVEAGVDPVSGRPVGMGRVGNLTTAMRVEDFTQYCLRSFNLLAARLIVNPLDQDKIIKRVAILGGSGSEFYQQAKAKGADAYVTGDVTYHTAHDIQANRLVVVDAGHHIEVVAAHGLAELLRQWVRTAGFDFAVCESTVNTEPFQFVTRQ